MSASRSDSSGLKHGSFVGFISASRSDSSGLKHGTFLESNTSSVSRFISQNWRGKHMEGVRLREREKKCIIRRICRLSDAQFNSVQIQTVAHIASSVSTETVFSIESLEPHDPLLPLLQKWINDATLDSPGWTQADNDRDAFIARVCRCCGSNCRVTACARCMLAYYCTEVCQRADWERHKIGCFRCKRAAVVTYRLRI